MGRHHSSNDDRSNSKNPNNPAYKAASDNRSNQLNPNNPRYQASDHDEDDDNKYDDDDLISPWYTEDQKKALRIKKANSLWLVKIMDSQNLRGKRLTFDAIMEEVIRVVKGGGTPEAIDGVDEKWLRKIIQDAEELRFIIRINDEWGILE